MAETTDVENYESKEWCIVHGNIDHVFYRNGLFRFDAFSYTLGDCLFDSFHVLLHFRYSSIELKNGLIDHLFVCLDNKDIEALKSYQFDLGSNFLYKLHGIHEINIYLSKMQLVASSNVNEKERGFWGDTFCI
jgi:hypothetical protein